MDKEELEQWDDLQVKTKWVLLKRVSVSGSKLCAEWAGLAGRSRESVGKFVKSSSPWKDPKTDTDLSLLESIV